MAKLFPEMAAAADSKWRNTALLVIDMQNDFILPGGPMHVKGGEAIVPNAIKAIEVSRSRGIPVIWVVREHDPSGRDVELFRRHLYSAGKPNRLLRAGVGVKNLVIIGNMSSRLGVQTPNCVRQTVFDAVALDYETVTVIVDATAAATPDIHNANISDMRNVGVVIPTLEEWCKVDD
ncbi:hypothetical protein F511_06003 [Dorcoceras hygrometricum]|uniref:Isochorismatase-like domain-containing protein n=1 Tax=Dorcoceras hygrometricum TaxID=472368 RepID=A0A2Z7B3F9_9LAMI|nr:hypothetical protein F511_06003 [Dorcoceras hygrometricum]